MARILIIDDNPAILRTYSELLKAEGHRVYAAGSLQAARLAIAESEPDVAVCDLELKEGNTMPFAEELRTAFPDARVIMITGSPSIDAVAEGIRYGIRDYLAKPVSREELLRSVTLAVREHSLAALSRQLVTENENYRQRLEQMVAEGTADLQAVLGSLLESRDAERIRLARTLHDGLGQDLSALRLQLQTLSDSISENTSLRERARSLAEMADALVKEVRTMSREQNPLLLREIGFPEALAALTARYGAILDGPLPGQPAAPDEYGLGRVYLVLEEGLAIAAAAAAGSPVHLAMPTEHPGTFSISPFPEPSPIDIDWLLFQERAWAAGVGATVETDGVKTLYIHVGTNDREAACPASL